MSLPRHPLPAPGPGRPLALAQLVNALGDGAFYVTSALYFSRVVGLTAAQIGVGLTVGWSVGLLASVPVGRLADVRGARPVAVALAAATAVAIGGFLLVGLAGAGPVAFTLTCCAYAAAQTGSGVARQTLLGEAVAPADRTAVRARMQVAGNAGLGVGAVLGGAVLAVDRPAAYLAAFVVDAVGFVAAAVVLTRVPTRAYHRATDTGTPAAGTAPRRSGPGRSPLGRSPLGDMPYLLVTLLNGTLLLYMPMLSVVAPLWIATRTSAPTWAVAGLFVVNTLGVVLTQVRAGDAVHDVAGAVRAVRRAGVLLMASCAIFAATAFAAPAWTAVTILLAAAVLQVCGEVRLAAGGWQLAFDLAPAAQQGRYQGVFGTGSAVARAIGPMLLTGVVLGGGVLGWAALGLVFLLAGAATGPAARWAQRSGRARDAGAPRPDRAKAAFARTIRANAAFARPGTGR